MDLRIDSALFGATVALLLWGVVGGVILRAACAFHNKLNGGPFSLDAVPEPSVSRSMLISFLAVLATLVVNYFLFEGFGSYIRSNIKNWSMTTIFHTLLVHLFSFLVIGNVFSQMLPTTRGRGMLIAAYYSIVYVILVVIIASALLIFGIV